MGCIDCNNYDSCVDKNELENSESLNCFVRKVESDTQLKNSSPSQCGTESGD